MISISKTLVRSRHIFATRKLCILVLYPFPRSISTCSIDTNQPFKVSYLVNICGLSPESALKTSKLVKFDSPEKADAVFAFFKNHGFSETQVSKLIKILPQLATSNPEKTLLPKLQFLYSKGISVPDVAKMLSTDPYVLNSSLKNKLIPNFDFFTKFLQSEDETVVVIKRFPSILKYDLNSCVVSIIDISLHYGVPRSNIITLLTSKLTWFTVIGSEKFTKVIEEVKKMGLDPSKVNFVRAIYVLCSMSKPTWERKVEVYKRWGWSHEDILHAFRMQPLCMSKSEEGISAKMDFFVNKMGWNPLFFARRPVIMSLSLEKRIIPRCSVLLELLSKGLIKEKYKMTPLLESSDKCFLQKYVNCYEDEASHLLRIYHEKLGDLKEIEAIDP